MKIAMHQPQYLPWLGYLEKLDEADLFVIVDDVQFEKDGWQNRNRVKCRNHPAGWTWLTVPVRGRFQQGLNETVIADARPWRHKHLGTLRATYQRAPYFATYAPEYAEILARPFERLVDLNVALIRWMNRALGIEKELVLSSTLGIAERSSHRLVAACRELGADELLLGTGSLDYVDGRLFADAGVALRLQDYRHPVYPQGAGEFVPRLSALDLMLHAGPESLAILRSGRRWIDHPLTQSATVAS